MGSIVLALKINYILLYCLLALEEMTKKAESIQRVIKSESQYVSVVVLKQPALRSLLS